MKFGSWTYDKVKVDLQHKRNLNRSRPVISRLSGLSMGHEIKTTHRKNNKDSNESNGVEEAALDVREDGDEGVASARLGMNLQNFTSSVEFDLLRTVGIRNELMYPCCPDARYPDITFNITLRRKTLFYTVNLVWLP